MLHQAKEICEACRDGNILALADVLEGLGSHGVNEPNEEGLFPIHIALLYNGSSIAQTLLKTLLKNSADINAVDKRSGDSLLHLCLSFKPPEFSQKLVPFLLKRGCNGLIRNYVGKSAFDVAKDNGYSDLESLIREFPHNKHAADHYIPRSLPEKDSVSQEDIQDMKPAINPSLIQFIIANDIENIKKMLEQGVDTNFDVSISYQPIHYAVSKGQSNPLSILKLLEDHKAHMEYKTEENDTVLTLAIKKIEKEETCLAVVHYLKACGVSTSEKDNDGNDALSLARLRHFDSVVNILSNIHEFEGPYHPIHSICRNKNLNEKKKISSLENPYFRNHISVDLLTKPENETCLHIACRNNDAEVVKYLLEKNATVRINNKNGETPLSITKLITKNSAIEQMLLEADKKQNPKEYKKNIEEIEENIEKDLKADKKRCIII